MSTDVIERLRDGVEAKAFTLKQVAKATGIPEQRLSDLKKRGFGPHVLTAFERKQKIEAALDKIAPINRRARGRRRA